MLSVSRLVTADLNSIKKCPLQSGAILVVFCPTNNELLLVTAGIPSGFMCCRIGAEFMRLLKGWYLSALRAGVFFAIALLAFVPVAVANGELTSAAWHQVMLYSPPTQHGCFEATYPSTVWEPVPCVSETEPPLTVGSIYGDAMGNAGTTLIQTTYGHVTSMTGFSSESDSILGANSYTIQLNSETFPTTYGGESTIGWQQFVFRNNGCSGCDGNVFIEYALVNWYTNNNNTCPPGIPAGGSYWQPWQGSCYANSYVVHTTAENPSNLANLQLQGSAGGTNEDVIILCDQSTCWSLSVTETILNLYQNWYHTEWNVLGTGGGSTAIFNQGTSGPSISITVQLYDTSNSPITPTCNTSYSPTAEMNNLNLAACGTGTGYYSFLESK
jgi:hypothetical protein